MSVRVTGLMEESNDTAQGPDERRHTTADREIIRGSTGSIAHSSCISHRPLAPVRLRRLRPDLYVDSYAFGLLYTDCCGSYLHFTLNPLRPCIMASQNSNPNADPVFFGGIEVDITQFDFSDHTSKVNSLTITCAVFIALVVLTVGLRLFARAKYVGHIFIDDCTGQPIPSQRSQLIYDSPYHLRRRLHCCSGCSVYRW